MKRPATQMSLEEMREPIPPAPHPPLSIDRGARKRDEVIEAIGMDATRAELIAKATEVAVAICKRNGSVTSPEVLSALRADRDLAAMLASVDPRVMGGVLVPSRGWKKLEGTVNTGSRGRAVPRWTR